MSLSKGRGTDSPVDERKRQLHHSLIAPTAAVADFADVPYRPNQGPQYGSLHQGMIPVPGAST